MVCEYFRKFEFIEFKLLRDFFFFLILNSERNERIIDFVFGRCDSIKLMKFNQNFIVFLQRYN